MLLVLGTHGRGIWILDNLSSLQELTPEVLASTAHLFSVEPAEMIRYARLLAQPGDMIFHGKNPPAGAIIDYYLRELAEDDVSLEDADELKDLVFELRRRIRILYDQIRGWTGRPTEEQQAQIQHLAEVSREMQTRLGALTGD